MNPATQEMFEQRIEEQEEQIHQMKVEFKNLFEMHLDEDHLDHDGEMYEEGDENAPFFSESYLYNLLGKEDARTVLAYLHIIEQWLGMREGQENPRFLADARKRIEMKKALSRD